MSTEFIASLVAHARQASELAADYLRTVVRQPVEVQTKVNIHDPVTVHDLHCESLIARYLSRAVPGSRILGEEGTGKEIFGDGVEGDGSADGGVEGDDGERVRWIVDPIDGTAAFAAGIAQFCVSIAVEYDGEVVGGAITNPLSGDRFWSNPAGAWVHCPGHAPRALDVKNTAAFSPEQSLVLSYYPNPGELRAHGAKALELSAQVALGHATVRKLGSCALDLAAVAAGWAQIMTGTTMKPWDVAAGLHLLKMAGGHLRTWDVHTSRGMGEQYAACFVASGARVDTSLIEGIWERVATLAND